MINFNACICLCAMSKYENIIYQCSSCECANHIIDFIYIYISNSNQNNDSNLQICSKLIYAKLNFTRQNLMYVFCFSFYMNIKVSMFC